MSAYYPLEDDVPVKPPPAPTPVYTPPVVTNSFASMFANETSECNYLVLAFIIGVLLLAFTDAMKR